MMERVNQILNCPRYAACMAKIQEHEATRIFCGHDMGHLLDVARLAWIINIEEELNIPKERIYATALLHDIGRFVQYEDGTPHQLASLPIAEEILGECHFSEAEIKEILEAIGNHRNAAVQKEKNLSGILYRADKLSRSCFGCAAQRACDWSLEKKNMKIVY